MHTYAQPKFDPSADFTPATKLGVDLGGRLYQPGERLPRNFMAGDPFLTARRLKVLYEARRIEMLPKEKPLEPEAFNYEHDRRKGRHRYG
jgi:hypothetical protein